MPSPRKQSIAPQGWLFSRKAVRRRSAPHPLTFYEFFAGGGMVRAGLGKHWTCLFANDFDFKKSAVYTANWSGQTLLTKDVREIRTNELPGRPNLVWASFPCQDLSLAGMGAGLRGDRSGTFWPFWKLFKRLEHESRGPDVVVLENVCGTLTSHGGKDFTAIANALAASNYRFGAVVIDAVDFVPHSRPRLFIIGAAPHMILPEVLVSEIPITYWHNRSVRTAYGRLNQKVRELWAWWNLPMPPKRTVILEDILEENPTSVPWHSEEETTRLHSMMSDVNLEKVQAAKHAKHPPLVGTIYKRTRLDEHGTKVQRAEVRFDGVAGCLRTPAGGSSRQVIFVVNEADIRSRLISSRETARLMGLPDTYKLPENYNEAYHLTGDGVVVPVVSYLASNLLEPIIVSQPHERNSMPAERAAPTTH